MKKMSKQEFNDDLMISMGNGLMDVELTEKEYDYVFRRARDTYKQLGANDYRECYFRLPVSTQKGRYVLPDEITEVIRVMRPDKGTAGYYGGGYEGLWSPAMAQNIFSPFQSGMNTGGEYVTWILQQSLYDMYDYVRAYEAQFNFDRFTHTIDFTREPRTKNETWVLECYADLTDDEYRGVLWVQRWATAEALSILGAAYSKISTIAGPTGDIQLDGNSMIQRAEEMKRDLKDEANQGLSGDGDYWGVTIG